MTNLSRVRLLSCHTRHPPVTRCFVAWRYGWRARSGDCRVDRAGAARGARAWAACCWSGRMSTAAVRRLPRAQDPVLVPRRLRRRSRGGRVSPTAPRRRAVREYAPSIVYEPGEKEIPIDFRRCRATNCGDAPTARSLDVSQTSAGMPATAFTHVLHQGGSTFIQYWFYYPDSNTTWAGSDKAYAVATAPLNLGHKLWGRFQRRRAIRAAIRTTGRAVNPCLLGGRATRSERSSRVKRLDNHWADMCRSAYPGTAPDLQGERLSSVR